MFNIEKLPTELGERHNATLLNGILRGIEREALRVEANGRFSEREHPLSLGSALTHPMITTDFSEALLEFITPPTHRFEALFDHLSHIHRFAIQQLDDELLWTHSMPCILPGDENAIPVARYGSSHNGRMKTVYRLGLGHRYGRAMQTVAGLHYNFSLPNSFWAHFHARDNSLLSLEEYKNQRYFSLIRNFRRHYWLLILLFGASPAMCKSFVGEREHNLDTFPGNKALYRPYATSLRMGDLGYQSSAQENLFICYNRKQTYIETLAKAILSPFPAYQKLPLKDEHGEYQQLSQGLLQIENEFYSAIRPKRSAKPGETALTALHKRGVEYIEVRCLDINPFTPLGITETQVAFLDTFLLYCALAPSPESDMEEFRMILANQKAVVNRGRDPELMLEHREHGALRARDWANGLFDAMKPVAALLDNAFEQQRFSQALKLQGDAIQDYDLLPSARLLAELETTDQSYPQMALAQSRAHTAELAETAIDPATLKRFEDMAEESHAEQRAMEARCNKSFSDFIAKYFKQYRKLL